MQIEKEILNQITAVPTPKIIAISGFGGSGKSTFAQQLGASISAPVISIDSFQKDATNVQFSFWETMDFLRFEREVLKPFADGESTLRYGDFDRNTDGGVDSDTVEISHKGVLIVEGVGIFRTELLKYFNIKIWIDCSLDVAEARGIKRDREVFHSLHDAQWYKTWRENDEQYFETHKPKEVADIVVPNE